MLLLDLMVNASLSTNSFINDPLCQFTYFSFMPLHAPSCPYSVVFTLYNSKLPYYFSKVLVNVRRLSIHAVDRFSKASSFLSIILFYRKCAYTYIHNHSQTRAWKRQLLWLVTCILLGLLSFYISLETCNPSVCMTFNQDSAFLTISLQTYISCFFNS